MAAIDFPASPTDGQFFAAGNGVVYQWSAAKGLWLLTGGVGPVIISPTAPSSPQPGALWWCNDATSGGGQLYVYYQDPNTSQWVAVAAPAANAPPTFIGFMKYWSVASGALAAGANDLQCWDTTDFDNTGGVWASNSTFTVPANRGGVWGFDINLMYATPQTGTWLVCGGYIVVNGSALRHLVQMPAVPVSSILTSTPLSVKLRLNSGDVVKIQSYASSAPMTFYGSGTGVRYSWWHGQWMGQ